jgi:hypothetical protein
MPSALRSPANHARPRGRKLTSAALAVPGVRHHGAVKEPLARADVEQVVVKSVGVEFNTYRELTEGTFNAAYALTLGDGRELVLKVAPPHGTPLLTYERDLLATEAMCLQRFASRVPAPELVAAGMTSNGRGFVLTSMLPGASWSSRAADIGPAARRALRRQVGRHVAAMHTVTGNGRFGYPSGPLGAPSWAAAYQLIIGALLADAARLGVSLPAPAEQMRDRLARAAATSSGSPTRGPGGRCCSSPGAPEWRRCGRCCANGCTPAMTRRCGCSTRLGAGTRSSTAKNCSSQAHPMSRWY